MTLSGGWAVRQVAHAVKVQGRPLDASALPHPAFWAEARLPTLCTHPP